MRLVFLGNFAVDFTSESHYVKELESLGHTVVKLQEGRATGDEVMAESLRADALIWVHSHSVNTLGKPMPAVIKQLARNQIPSIAYHLDLYMGLERWKEYQESDYFGVTHFFTVDKLMANWLNENTRTIAYYLPAGVFSQEAIYTPETIKHQIVFTGSKSYHKEWPYRTELIDWLEHTYGSRFEHYGNDGIRRVRGLDLNHLYASTKIVIGDTLCPDFEYPDYWSDRIYEVTGRGGFIIHPYIQGLETQFKIGTEIATYQYGDFDQLKSLIDYYLDNEIPREAMRNQGHARTKADHTYRNRWEAIFKKVGI